MAHFVYVNCDQCNRKLTTASSERFVRGVTKEGEEILVCSLTCATSSRTDPRWEHASDSWYFEARTQVVALGATHQQAATVVLELGLPYHNPHAWTRANAEQFTKRLQAVVLGDRYRAQKETDDGPE